MAAFEFYMEMADGRTIPTNYETPETVLSVRNIDIAIKKFARKQRLELIEYDALMNDNGYRVFFDGGKKKGEYVYFVSERAEG